jgi:hypothetical protein
VTQISAPWTAEQVAALNRWQDAAHVHPFTCGGNRTDATHRAYQASHPDQDFGQLVATENGWACPACGYRQSWAHDFMLTTPPSPGAPS